MGARGTAAFRDWPSLSIHAPARRRGSEHRSVWRTLRLELWPPSRPRGRNNAFTVCHRQRRQLQRRASDGRALWREIWDTLGSNGPVLQGQAGIPRLFERVRWFHGCVTSVVALVYKNCDSGVEPRGKHRVLLVASLDDFSGWRPHGGLVSSTNCAARISRFGFTSSDGYDSAQHHELIPILDGNLVSIRQGSVHTGASARGNESLFGALVLGQAKRLALRRRRGRARRRFCVNSQQAPSRVARGLSHRRNRRQPCGICRDRSRRCRGVDRRLVSVSSLRASQNRARRIVCARRGHVDRSNRELRNAQQLSAAGQRLWRCLRIPDALEAIS